MPPLPSMRRSQVAPAPALARPPIFPPKPMQPPLAGTSGTLVEAISWGGQPGAGQLSHSWGSDQEEQVRRQGVRGKV